MNPRLPVFFISHGGGPWSYMNDASRAAYAQLEAALADMPRQVGVTPTAVLIISAHWEEREFTLTAHPAPPMLYDYYGFPDYTYQVRYEAPGNPALAARVRELIEAAGMPARLDPVRGFDHGAFTPLKVIYPDARVPVVQLSLKTGLDPATHVALGRVLAPLRDDGVLIVGSGLTYHNLRQFGSPRGWEPSRQFDAWLNGDHAGWLGHDARAAPDSLGERTVGARGASARRTPAAAHGRRGRGGARYCNLVLPREGFSRRLDCVQLPLRFGSRGQT